MASISQERFLQFADLALAAFNSKNESIKAQAQEILNLTEQLAEALSNDAADAEAITQAQVDAEAAKATLAEVAAKNERENQELVDAIGSLEVELGISPVPTPLPAPVPTEPEPTPVV